MSDTAVTVIVAALSGGAVGAITSLALPWAVWGVEKRRERLAHRRALIASWRSGLVRWEKAASKSNGLPELYTTDWFGSLELHMQARLAGQERTIVVTPVGDRYGVAATIHSEIDRIEREWKLS